MRKRAEQGVGTYPKEKPESCLPDLFPLLSHTLPSQEARGKLLVSLSENFASSKIKNVKAQACKTSMREK